MLRIACFQGLTQNFNNAVSSCSQMTSDSKSDGGMHSFTESIGLVNKCHCRGSGLRDEWPTAAVVCRVLVPTCSIILSGFAEMKRDNVTDTFVSMETCIRAITCDNQNQIPGFWEFIDQIISFFSSVILNLNVKRIMFSPLASSTLHLGFWRNTAQAPWSPETEAQRGSRGLRTGSPTPHIPASAPRSPGCQKVQLGPRSPCPLPGACWHICLQRSLHSDACCARQKYRAGGQVCTQPFKNSSRLISRMVLPGSYGSSKRGGSGLRKIKRFAFKMVPLARKSHKTKAIALKEVRSKYVPFTLWLKVLCGHFKGCFIAGSLYVKTCWISLFLLKKQNKTT